MPGKKIDDLPPLLELYFDPECTKAVDNLSFDLMPLGTTKAKTVYTINRNMFPVYPTPRAIKDPDLKLIRHPTKLEPGDRGSVELEFSPPLSRRAPFKDVMWGLDVNF